MLFLHKANPEIVMRGVYTGPNKFLNKLILLPVQQQVVYTEPMQILLQIAVMFAAQKLARLRR